MGLEVKAPEISQPLLIRLFLLHFTRFTMEQPEKDEKKPGFDKWKIIHFAFEMGFIIAIPLLVLILLGKWLDAKFGTDPGFALAGTLLAIASTVVWLGRRFKQLM